MQEGDATWSLGVLIGIPIILAVIAVLVGLGLWLRSYAKRHEDESFSDAPEAKWLARGLFALVGVVVIGSLIGYYPWKADYHQFVTKEGTVKTISSRLLGSSDSFQQKFVVQYEDGRQFGCEDTRCALIKPGDRLILACKRAWQYAGQDGYDCKFIEGGRV